MSSLRWLWAWALYLRDWTRVCDHGRRFTEDCERCEREGGDG